MPHLRSAAEPSPTARFIDGFPSPLSPSGPVSSHDEPSQAARPFEAGLTSRGLTIRLQTRGRASGLPRWVTIGFLEHPDGSLLVAASSEQTHWARNLAADPRCVVERAGRHVACTAEPLAGAEAHEAVVGLILRYGTPAERLGGGPAFRLVPRAPE
jgi:deazaflavin-dependent oxidoreductase (nitroreductase family)